MSKFHINKQGVPAPCKAKDRNCPLGGEEQHFKSQQEAQDYVDKENKSKHGLLPSTKTQNQKDERMTIAKLNKMNGYVVVTEYFHQYAIGVNGANRTNKIITDNGQTFSLKRDAREYAKNEGLKSESKKGKPDEGYGSVGAKSFKVSFVKASELGPRENNYTIK